MIRLYSFLGTIAHYVVPAPLLPKGKRVRVAIITNDNYILLIRNWFGYQNWALPGGGVQKGETAKKAAVREVKEETGLDLRPQKAHTPATNRATNLAPPTT